MENSEGLPSRAGSLRPIVAAGLVFLLGFACLLGWYRWGPSHAQLPGLFAFRSATWGDGVCLPLAAACLVSLIGELPAVGRRRLVPLCAGVLGAIAGVAVLWSWQSDPRPRLNWTLPSPHTLNHAGVWHAAFLVGTTTAFAAGWVYWLTAATQAARSGQSAVLFRQLQSARMALLFGSLTSYAFLAAADAHPAGSLRLADLATVAGLAIGLVVLTSGMVLALGREAARAWPSLAAAALFAVAFLLVVADGPGTDPLIWPALLAAAGAGLAVSGVPDSGGWSSPRAGVHAVAAMSMFVALVAVPTVAAPAPVVDILCVVLAGALGAFGLQSIFVGARRWNAINVGGVFIAVSLLATARGALRIEALHGRASTTGAFLLTIVGAILGGVLLPYFKADFGILMKFEESHADDVVAGAEQSRLAVTLWQRVIGFAVGAFAGVLALTVAVAPSLGWQEGHVGAGWGPVAAPALLVVAVGCCLSVRLLRHADEPSPVISSAADDGSAVREVDDTAQLGSRHVVGVIIAEVAVIVGFGGDLRSDLNALSVAYSCVAALFVLESALGNGAWLHLVKVRGAARIAVALCPVAVFTSTYWGLAGVRGTSGPAPLLPSAAMWAVSAIVDVAIACLVVSAAYAMGGKWHLTPYAPLRNAAQDSVLLVILFLALGWLPASVVAHVTAAAPERWAAIGSVLTGFLFVFGPVFLWVLENNDTHVQRQWKGRARLSTPPAGIDAVGSWARFRSIPKRVQSLARDVRQPSQTDMTNRQENEHFVRRLSGHTAIQNLVAIAAVVLSGVGLVGVASALDLKVARAGMPPKT